MCESKEKIHSIKTTMQTDRIERKLLALLVKHLFSYSAGIEVVVAVVHGILSSSWRVVVPWVAVVVQIVYFVALDIQIVALKEQWKDH